MASNDAATSTAVGDVSTTSAMLEQQRAPGISPTAIKSGGTVKADISACTSSKISLTALTFTGGVSSSAEQSASFTSMRRPFFVNIFPKNPNMPGLGSMSCSCFISTGLILRSSAASPAAAGITLFTTALGPYSAICLSIAQAFPLQCKTNGRRFFVASFIFRSSGTAI